MSKVLFLSDLEISFNSLASYLSYRSVISFLQLEDLPESIAFAATGMEVCSAVDLFT